MRIHPLTAFVALALTFAVASHADEKKAEKKTAVATFAGGCFWCMEPPYDFVKGVKRTTSGYTGGTTKNPTYEQVCTGKTGHAEAVEIEYDPAQVTLPATARRVLAQHRSDRQQPAVRRPRDAVSHRDLLSRRRAEAAGGGI